MAEDVPRAGEAGPSAPGTGLIIPRRRLVGFVDRVVGGEVRGWAFDPRRPDRRVHVVAICEGKVVAEALADIHRRDLLEAGCGDGRCAFRMTLPPRLLDGAPRRVSIEAVSRFGRVRLSGGRLDLASGPDQAPAAARAQAPPSAAPMRARQEAAALLVLGAGSDADVARTLASWRAQGWPERSACRLGPAAEGIDGFGPDDGERLTAFAAAAHTLVLARAGDEIDPDAARMLVQAQPLGDVVTWDGGTAASRRPDARALGVLLGERLGGRLAVRGHVLASLAGGLGELLEPDGERRLELRLAARAGLRWTHLPAALLRPAATVPDWAPVEETQARGLTGYGWAQADHGAPARLVPAGAIQRLTLAVWPGWDEDARASLASLLAAAPACEIEVLAPAGQDQSASAGLAAIAPGRVRARAFDPPAGGGAGAWLRALGEAASGEVVVICRSGVRLDEVSGPLDELALWALSPLAGAASMPVETANGMLAGLRVERTSAGWRAGSAFDAGQAGRARPVLGAPAGLMVVSRARLASLGGFDDRRFPAAGADLELGLGLRRLGQAAVLLGWARASGPPGLAAAAQIKGTALAPFDPGELAAAAAAYPASAAR